MKRISRVIGIFVLAIGILLIGVSKSAENFMRKDFSHLLMKQLQSEDIVTQAVNQLEIEERIKPLITNSLIQVMNQKEIANKIEVYTNEIIKSLLTDDVVKMSLNEDIQAALINQEDTLYLGTKHFMSKQQTHDLIINLANVVDLESIYQSSLIQMKTQIPPEYQKIIQILQFIYEGYGSMVSLGMIVIGSLLIVLGTRSIFNFMKCVGIASIFSGCLFLGSMIMITILMSKLIAYPFLNEFLLVWKEAFQSYCFYTFLIGSMMCLIGFNKKLGRLAVI